MLTRDGATGALTAYVNGVQQFAADDGSNEWAVAPAVLHFFMDDEVWNLAEASPGVVEYIRIYDGVLTPQQVVDLSEGGPPPGATPAQAVETLMGEVAESNLASGLSNSLNAKLAGAVTVLEDTNETNDGVAVNKLEAFTNEVDAQTDKKIPIDVADDLIGGAEQVIDQITSG